MNSLQGLLYGLSVAATPANLLAAFVGAFAGTAIGVLPASVRSPASR
jgi:putative tricarboxylic transport membrane protein